MAKPKAKHADKNNPPTKKKPQPKAAAAKPAPAPKAKKPAKDPKPETKKVDFNSPMNEDDRRLFLQLLPGISKQKATVATAVADLRNLYKQAKGHGFDKVDFDLAEALDTAEKEAKERAKIARKLTIAKYCGKSLGAQLDMFLEPDRTPSSALAFEEGKIAAMSNKAARPDYDPSTEQHREYMRGFHEATEGAIKAGIKPLEAPGPTLIKAADKAKPAPAAAPAAPAPIRMTKADYMAERQAAKRIAEAAFKQPDPEPEVDRDDDEVDLDDDAPSAFEEA